MKDDFPNALAFCLAYSFVVLIGFGAITHSFLMSYIKEKQHKHRFRAVDMEAHITAPHDERIHCRCCDCGKLFKAYCGLDIIQHGKYVYDNDPPTDFNQQKFPKL